MLTHKPNAHGVFTAEECLLCHAPLEYLVEAEMMECAICHKQEFNKAHCKNGHYVCSDCHTEGMDSILGLCLSGTSDDPSGREEAAYLMTMALIEEKILDLRYRIEMGSIPFE